MKTSGWNNNLRMVVGLFSSLVLISAGCGAGSDALPQGKGKAEVTGQSQSHAKDVETCAQRAADPSYQEFGFQGDNLKATDWEKCLTAANDQALASKALAPEELKTVDAYRDGVSTLCDQLTIGSDSFGGSINEFYYNDCLKKKERLLADLLDTWAIFPGQEPKSGMAAELFPSPSPDGNKSCHAAYEATVAGTDDDQVIKSAVAAHTQCLISSQFNHCMAADNHYSETTRCYEEVVLAKKSTILAASLDNLNSRGYPVEPELEGDIEKALSGAITAASDICETIVAFGGRYDNCESACGQLIDFDRADCLQDALGVLTLEIDTFVSWIDWSEDEGE